MSRNFGYSFFDVNILAKLKMILDHYKIEQGLVRSF